MLCPLHAWSCVQLGVCTILVLVFENPAGHDHEIFKLRNTSEVQSNYTLW